jgi:Bacterial Ig-like domain (group 3)
MKTERFKRTKSVVASTVIALVVAAMTFGVSSAVLRPATSPFAASSGSAFTISSAIYPSPACSGSTTLLWPGVTECAVLTIHNNLSVPVTVQNLSTTIPSPPAGCPASNFDLPTFSGSLSVPASGSASTAGLPISLIDTGTNQDACLGVTVHFTYSGSAQYTDATATAVAATPVLPVLGQPVVLTATVTAANAATDPSGPTGTVTFYACPTAACATTTSLGTATVGPNGKAVLSSLNLLLGRQYVEAVYGGSGTDFTRSTSPAIPISVVAAVTLPGNATLGSGPTPPSSSPSSVAFTGADIAGMTVAGLLMIGLGTVLVLVVRRRRKTAGSES